MMEMEKSWIEVERDESITLLRDKLEMINQMEAEELDCDDIHMLKDIWSILKGLKDW